MVRKEEEMLKIKDDVDLKELERFGFKPKYDEDSGNIKAYQKILKEKEYIGLNIRLEHVKSILRIFKWQRDQWRINPYKDLFDIDTLYDLIQAGLVEKVDDK